MASGSKAAKRETKVVEIDWKTKATTCVNRLYTSGSDARQEKNGNPNALINKMLKASAIRTCGLFARLSAEDRKIIDDKDSEAKRNDPEFRARIAKFILESEKKQALDDAIFIKLSDEGRLILDAIAKKVECDGLMATKIRKQFVIRSIFENQERQKVLQR